MLGCNQDDFTDNHTTNSNHKQTKIEKITGDRAKAIVEKLNKKTKGFGRLSVRAGAGYKTVNHGTIRL